MVSPMATPMANKAADRVPAVVPPNGPPTSIQRRGQAPDRRGDLSAGPVAVGGGTPLRHRSTAYCSGGGEPWQPHLDVRGEGPFRFAVPMGSMPIPRDVAIRSAKQAARSEIHAEPQQRQKVHTSFKRSLPPHLVGPSTRAMILVAVQFDASLRSSAPSTTKSIA